MTKEKMTCAWNDDSGLHNAYMKKLRLDIMEDADDVERRTHAMLVWGNGFEQRLMKAKAGINLEADPAAQTFAQEWKQLKYDFDSYMGEVSQSNRLELESLWAEKDQFETRLRELPQIKIPHYPKPPPPLEEKQEPKPAEFVVRGAHNEEVPKSEV